MHKGMNHLHVEITSPIQNSGDSLNDPNLKKNKKEKKRKNKTMK